MYKIYESNNYIIVESINPKEIRRYTIANKFCNKWNS